MADYIDIDTPIDVAVYQRNRRIQVTLRQILDSNDAKYQPADVRPVVRGKWKHSIQGIIPSGQCSNCGAWDKVTRFCPNCGAQMEES